MKTINVEYRNRIKEIVEELKFGTPERIRLEYMNRFKDNISWITIKRHLERLYNEDYINKDIISKGIKRSIIIYKSK